MTNEFSVDVSEHLNMINDEQIKELITHIKQELSLSNCQINQAGNDIRSYEITTPEGDLFWFYFYVKELPNFHLQRQPFGRPQCKQSFIYEKTIIAHIKHSFSLYYSG